MGIYILMGVMFGWISNSPYTAVHEIVIWILYSGRNQTWIRNSLQILGTLFTITVMEKAGCRLTAISEMAAALSEITTEGERCSIR